MNDFLGGYMEAKIQFNNLTNKIKRITLMKVFRRITQLVFFIFLPGIFTSVFDAIKDIYLAILNESFSMEMQIGSILIVSSVLFVTVVMGRFFCGFMCSFGSMGDVLWFLSKKVFHLKFIVSERMDAVLKKVKYLVLALVVLLSWTMGISTLSGTASPWTIFGMFAKIGNWPSANYFISIGGILLLFIIIGSLLIERFFCRYLCPLGAIFTVTSRFRWFRIDKKKENCGSCKLCTSKCSMGIPLYRENQVKSGECINCFACTNHCPTGNAKANIRPQIVTNASIALATILFFVGNLATVYAASEQTQTTLMTSAYTSDSESGPYVDGMYTGEAYGFRGFTEVLVTVENGYIADIEVTDYEDDLRYFVKAEGTIISRILSTQETEVDAVSGATFSSDSIMNAVANALSESITTSTDINDDFGSESELSGAQIDSGNLTEILEGSYTDGIFVGTGTGYKGEIEVQVIVENGLIEEISILSSGDDVPYFMRAEGTILSEVVESQNVDVDTVSGATFSSNGILEAIADALNLDFTNPNSTLERGHGSGRGGRH